MSQISFPTVLTDEQFIQNFLNQLKQRRAELGSVALPSDLTPVGMPAIGSAHLQSLLDAIPYANDGDVIRADHFNTIRAALAQLAAELGLSPRPIGVDVLSIFPIQSAGIAAPWEQQTDDIAAPPATAPGATTATTYIPITLPNGVDILALGAAGEQESPSVNVALQRRMLTTDPDIDAFDRIMSFIPKTSGPFYDKQTALRPGNPSTFRRVDNTLFSYFLRVTWSPVGPPPNSAKLSGLQITYTSR
jgi:hypothetical protein